MCQELPDVLTLILLLNIYRDIGLCKGMFKHSIAIK